MHWPGIEPGPPAWQARILPLNHHCFVEYLVMIKQQYLKFGGLLYLLTIILTKSFTIFPFCHR